MFIDNKYTKWYFKLIDSRKERIFEINDYSEKHHIIPKSLGGSNKKDNIIKLTAKEHFICHRLLVKMTEGKEKVKMSYALRCMINRENTHQKRYKITGAKYEKIIIETKAILSENTKGKNNSFYGKTHTDETKKRLSLLRNKRHSEGSIEGMINKNHTDESKQKIREATIKQFSNKANREVQRQKALEQFKDPVKRYEAGNGKRGKKWFYNPITLDSVMCFEKDKPDGYLIGRTGKKGIKVGKRGSHGKKWYYHPITLDNIMCSSEDRPHEYIKGRKIKKEKEVVA